MIFIIYIYMSVLTMFLLLYIYIYIRTVRFCQINQIKKSAVNGQSKQTKAKKGTISAVNGRICCQLTMQGGNYKFLKQ